MSPWAGFIGALVLVVSFSGSASPGLAEVASTATVVQPASVMDSFSLPMTFTASDPNWRSLKIVAPMAPPVQAASATSATGDAVPRTVAVAEGLTAPMGPVSVPAATASATPAPGRPLGDASVLPKGSMIATLQVTPAGTGVLAEVTGVMRLTVAFN